ncbi:MAG: multicopper oxidase domain-containing protein [Anaerolineales bacterium]|nr:multicopper oxidase domain-containing protein [Anaerolineales bacterium]
MRSKELSRRDFLRLLGIGSGAAVLSACAPKTLTETAFPPTAIPESGAASAPAGEVDVEIALKAVEGEAQILSGKPTRVWQYQGEVLSGPADSLKVVPNSYLGPIFNVKKGQTIRVHFTNELNEESIVHWHGLHVPVEADGHPRLAIGPGETYVYDFKVLDRAGTYWYHPHPHGRTGPQAYAGLAGLFLISDDEESALGLPSGDYDVPVVIQDRLFDKDNQLVYGGNGMMDQMMGFLGNRILVNGQAYFSLKVATRPYRLRLHNGSNSRIYKLGWEDGTPFKVIATDGGLLEQPVDKQYITLAPAQRVDVWVDFSGRAVGDSVRLVNFPAAAPDGGTTFPIMTVEVDRAESVSAPLPERLSTIAWHNEADAVNAASPREFVLAMSGGMGWTLNGHTFEMTATAKDEVVKLGDLEFWQFTNQLGGGMGMGGGMSLPHPMHVHGLQYQIIERQVEASGRADWDSLSEGFVDEGWHDTVLVMPGEKVRILLKFEDFTGLYLYHCHNLEHEDMGMMRNYLVEA